MWALLKSLPALISLAREIWDALHEMYEEYEKKQKLKDLKEAVSVARKTKDTSKLEAIFNPGGAKPTSSGNG